MCTIRAGGCGSWSTVQILDNVDAVTKLSPKYSSEPGAASLHAQLSGSYPHSYPAPFKTAVSCSLLYFLFVLCLFGFLFCETSNGFNYLRTFCTFHLDFEVSKLFLSRGEGVLVR